MDAHDPNLSQTLYTQRRQVELLRRQLYGEPDPAPSPDDWQQLLTAEETLQDLEAQARRAAMAAPDGMLLSTDPGSRGTLMGADTTGIEATVLLRMDRVPSGIVHLLRAEERPLVSYRMRNRGDEPVRLRLSTMVEGYSAPAITSLELRSGQEAEVPHLPTFFPERLAPVKEITRATLRLSVDNLDGNVEQENTFPVWLLARDCAYLGVTDPSTGTWVDLAPYLAAWVTPHAPGVLDLLRAAAEKHRQRRIVGYQVDAAGVEAQVRAVYEAVAEAEVVYVNTVLSFGAGPGEAMQRVRLPAESLECRSANCIDGTVLMASVLEAASLNPALVLVPGHAFVAWETGNGNGQWDYVETTMVATHDFAAAQRSARALVARYQPSAMRLQNPRLFRLLSVPDLRANQGILPME